MSNPDSLIHQAHNNLQKHEQDYLFDRRFTLMYDLLRFLAAEAEHNACRVLTLERRLSRLVDQVDYLNDVLGSMNSRVERLERQ